MECCNADHNYILLSLHVLFVYWKKRNFLGIGDFLPFGKCAEH